VIAPTVSPLGNCVCQRGTESVKNWVRTPTMWAQLWILTVSSLLPGDAATVVLKVDEGGPVESNERYYRRRAVEERMAAQRAVTEQARAWHAKLAEDFAARAINCTAVICTQTAVRA